MMKHYISICADKEATEAKRIDLFDWSLLATLPEFAAKDKLDSMLVFNGYNSDLTEYPRRELFLNKFSSVFIDCDNETSDPDIVSKWKKEMEGYDYMIYETASSTPERPKFRAIVPLDGELDWDKYAKAAIFQIFSSFADEKASWFFTPTLDKLPTIYDHITGHWFPCEIIQREIDSAKRRDVMRKTNFAIAQMMNRGTCHKERNAEGWRNLPSVKKCLEGLSVGERDNSLCAACYAMDRNGYRDAIPQFLDEVSVDWQLKQKWRKRYH